MLDKLLKNKSVQKAFFGQFKDLVEKEGVKVIVIEMGGNGEIIPTIYKEPVKVLTDKEYNAIIDALKSNL